MSKIKKIICLLLSVIMLLSLNVPVFANDNTQNAINSLSTTEITENFQITVSTDKYSYNASSVATIYVSVKNVSDETLKNVKAQAVFDDLQPVSARKSTTSLEIAELKAGESFDFSYKATLNINKHNLNIFQKIFLWIVRLFNGGYTATNNSIDVIDENTTDIIFGNFTAKNIIQVGYKTNDSENSENNSNEKLQEELNKIKQLNNGKLPEIEYSDYNNIDWIHGNYYDGIITNETDAVSSLNSIKNIMNIESFNHNFVCRYSNTHDNTDFYRLQQYYNNYLIYGAEWIICVDNSTGKICSGNGSVIPEQFLDLNCNITTDDAKNIAQKDFGSNAQISEKTDLIFMKANKEDLKYYLTYAITVNGNKAPHIYYISAKNGEIINIDTWISSDRVSANGVDNKNQNRNFYCEKISDDLYYLVDSKKNISIYDAGNKDVSWELNTSDNTLNVYWHNVWYKFDSWFTKAQVIQNTKNEWNNRKAVTLMSNLNVAYDYFYNNIGIKGYDNKNGEVFAIINDNFDYDRGNAYSVAAPNVNTTIISFGVDNNIDLDVVAHEYTHSVMNSIVSLGDGESGALKEAYADIFGEIIENDTTWTHGERVLSNPTINNYPKYYKGEYWGDANSNVDKGYVHKNSTVISHSAYLMHINGVNNTVLANIWYKSISYLEYDSDFLDCRKAVLQAAELLNCNKETINIIKQSFNSVGIFDNEANNSYLMGTVIDKETNTPVEDASVLLQKIDEAGLIVGDYTCSTDKDGKFEISVPVGNYTYTINKLDMLNELYETATGTVTVSNVTGNVLATVYLSPKGNSGDDNTGDSGETERTVIDSGNCGADGDNVTWTLYEDGELVISGSGEMKDYSSDSSNRAPWYTFREDVKNIKIENGIISIGDYAFYYTDSIFYDDNLIKVIISDGVISIGKSAFDGCSKIETINLPNSITEIKSEAFRKCSNLTEISIPLDVKSIERYTFQGCTNLKNLHIPYGVTNIGHGAFSSCINLTTVIIPDSVLSIGSAAFAHCRNIENIEISNNVTIIPEKAFYECTSLNNVTIPNNVTYIGAESFSYCKSLEEITIPYNVTKIGDYAFYVCENLESVSILGNVSSIGRLFLGACNKLDRIYIDKNNNYFCSENNVIFNKNKSELICYPAGITSISYTVPSSVKSFSYGAFANNKFITNIVIQSDLLNIEDSTFFACSNLKSIVIPNSISLIGSCAFEYCDNLNDVYYTGTQEEWCIISIEERNEYLTNATIHYNS